MRRCNSKQLFKKIRRQNFCITALGTIFYWKISSMTSVIRILAYGEDNCPACTDRVKHVLYWCPRCKSRVGCIIRINIFLNTKLIREKRPNFTPHLQNEFSRLKHVKYSSMLITRDSCHNREKYTNFTSVFAHAKLNTVPLLLRWENYFVACLT